MDDYTQLRHVGRLTPFERAKLEHLQDQLPPGDDNPVETRIIIGRHTGRIYRIVECDPDGEG